MTRKVHKPIDTEHFEQILAGQKTFEFRVADFECDPGDILVLEEYKYNEDRSQRHPTGRTYRRKVGYIFKTKDADWLERSDVKANAEKYGFQVISLQGGVDLWEVSMKAIIFNPEKTKVLLPLYDYGVYGMVGGHLDHGETFDTALRREIKEEIGVDFAGEITEVTVDKREWTSTTSGRKAHKIMIICSLVLPEDTPLHIEEEGENIASLDWVALGDVFSDEFNLYAEYKNAIKKALRKDQL
jgi:ADP-ribose pyrophosphatase YjhB (NUDIX family)